MKTKSMRRAVLSVVALLAAGAAEAQQATALAGDFNPRWHRLLPGSDIALTGRPGWNRLPVAFSRGDGTFQVTNGSVGSFGAWASTAGVSQLIGDFDGDRWSDIALTGAAGWGSLPVAFSNGNGTFRVTNSPLVNFPYWASLPGQRLVGDFDGDRKSDIAAPTPSLNGFPMAFSNGDGTFRETACCSNAWPDHAPYLVGDFTGDGRDDLQGAWCAQPWIIVQRSEWSATTSGFTGLGFGGSAEVEFAGWACASGVKRMVGNFNHDATDDLLLIGAPDSEQLAVALFAPPFAFDVVTSLVGEFAQWASDPSVTTLLADFDADGLSDIALVGPSLWPVLPVAFSNGDGTFRLTAEYVGDFAGWAAGNSVRRLVGDYDNDGDADIALTGGVGWNTLPVAFSNGDGTFLVTNEYIGAFATWAAP